MREQLTWNEYLPRLEEELAGTYDRQKNPAGKYYTNLLEALTSVHSWQPTT